LTKKIDSHKNAILKIKRVLKFELFILYSYGVRFVFVVKFGLKYGKRSYPDLIPCVFNLNPSQPGVSKLGKLRFEVV